MEAHFDFGAVFEPEDYLHFLFYRDALTKERTGREVEFLVEKLELKGGMRILDLACGYGRHANLLAQLGYAVTGVDLTEFFLKMAKEEAKEKCIDVKYIQKDLRKISFREEFDRVLLLFTSFGYFDDDENLKVLKNVADALKPGGLFYLDTMNRDATLKNFRLYFVMEKGKDLMIDRNSFDSLTGRFYDKRIVIRDRMRKDKPFFVRLYNFNEIKDLLNRAGLKMHSVYGDWKAAPFTHNSKVMIIIAKKEV
jgi:SAM-dependent methyltransferase